MTAARCLKMRKLSAVRTFRRSRVVRSVDQQLLVSRFSYQCLDHILKLKARLIFNEAVGELGHRLRDFLAVHMLRFVGYDKWIRGISASRPSVPHTSCLVCWFSLTETVSSLTRKMRNQTRASSTG